MGFVVDRRGRALSLALSLLLGLVLSVAGPVQGQAAPIRIMPTGDSITEGAAGDATYRYFLWHLLTEAGYSVDFVGSMTGVNGGAPKYPDFDQNHEGHSGWTADRMNNQAKNWATASAAQIVLLHAGTNDLDKGQTVASTVTDLTNVINKFRSANPGIVVLIAQIIPIAGLDAKVQELNQSIAALASQMNTATSPVVAVDLHSGFSVSTDLKADGIHPTESGFQKMASDWFAALAPFLSTSPPPPPAGGALLVVGNAGQLSGADNAIRTRLVGLGLTVTVADDDSVQASAANGQAVVLISSTVDPSKVGNKFASTAVPLIAWEGALFDDLGMTGPVAGTNFGEAFSKKKVTIVQPSHPLAAGRSGTVIAVDPATRFNWGVPSSGGTVVAHVGGAPSQPAVFAYEAGAVMSAGTAPARRVGLFLYDTTALNLTGDGWAIFDAAVNWARS
jgi:acyl-CoA thioesterase-1